MKQNLDFLRQVHPLKQILEILQHNLDVGGGKEKYCLAKIITSYLDSLDIFWLDCLLPPDKKARARESFDQLLHPSTTSTSILPAVSSLDKRKQEEKKFLQPWFVGQGANFLRKYLEDYCHQSVLEVVYKKFLFEAYEKVDVEAEAEIESDKIYIIDDNSFLNAINHNRQDMLSSFVYFQRGIGFFPDRVCESYKSQETFSKDEIKRIETWIQNGYQGAKDSDSRRIVSYLRAQEEKELFSMVEIIDV